MGLRHFVSLAAMVVGVALVCLSGVAAANPFKDFGRAVKSGAKEVGHALKGNKGSKGAYRGGARAHTGVRAGGHHHRGGGARGGHHRGRHHRR